MGLISLSLVSGWATQQQGSSNTNASKVHSVVLSHISKLIELLHQGPLDGAGRFMIREAILHQIG